MYIVIEMQTTSGTTAVLPPVAYEDKKTAESAYHNILSAAALSDVPIHSAVVLDEYGCVIRNEYYEHGENET